MKCMLLKGKYMICCTAVKESYIPSMLELDEYCRGDNKMCPLYRQAEIDGKTIIMADTKKSAEARPLSTAVTSLQSKPD